MYNSTDMLEDIKIIANSCIWHRTVMNIKQTKSSYKTLYIFDDMATARLIGKHDNGNAWHNLPGTQPATKP